MVFGCSIAVTNVPRVSQCAEMQRMACGFGSSLPIAFHPLLNLFSSMAFIGLPCPTKSRGITFSCLPRVSLNFFKSLKDSMTVFVEVRGEQDYHSGNVFSSSLALPLSS